MIKEIDEDTKPIRQAMVMIRDEMNACTKDVQAQIDTIQLYRNSWAIMVENEKKRLAEEERKAAEKRQEIINIKAEIEKSLIKHFSDHLFAKKSAINTSFNAITLADFDQKSKGLINWIPKYADVHFKSFNYWYSRRILTNEEVGELIASIKTEKKFAEFASTYSDELIALRGEKIDLLPSKKLELERIAEFEREQEAEKESQRKIEEEKKNANEARRKQLEQEQKESEARQREARERELEETRQREDREKKEREEEEEKNRLLLAEQNRNIEVCAAQETTMSLFEQTANTNTVTSSTKTKTVLMATITAPVGIYPIFQLWMEGVGMKMTPGELTKEFSKMFTYASKQANAKQPLKIENEFVSYMEDVKAVTTKSKKEEMVS